MADDKYDLEVRTNAATLYYTERDFSKVGKVMVIPHTTIRYWATQDWWAECMERFSDEYEKKMDVKFRTLITRFLDKAEEEIDSCKPYQAVMAATVLFDKRQILHHKPTSISGKSDAEARLKELGKQMKKVNKDIVKPEEPEKEDAHIH